MNVREREDEVRSALEPAFRGQLLARGQARSMIWRDGDIPAGAPQFARNLSYDLVSYGVTLVDHAIYIHTRNGDNNLARRAFLQAGEAIEAVVTKGMPNDPQRGFLRTMSAAAFHLGRSSARAYSMLFKSLENANLSRLERGLALLILRSIDQLESEIVEWRRRGTGSDKFLSNFLEDEDQQRDNEENEQHLEDSVFIALDTALCDQFYSGLGSFLLALQVGEESLVTLALSALQTGLKVSSDTNLVPQWWCFRLAIHLIDDLWQASFHRLLPKVLPDGESTTWSDQRSLFIASLYRRSRAEIELWPSQIEGARRSVDSSDSLVVSLPTSAGKTRVAELCILRCLSEGKRVVYVTPLRALSAQTETALQMTFAPLGKSISALYGSMGTSALDEDTLRKRDIVVATPEKLDFALRNDPSILNDVGLIVLDEGHMIGLGEREVRYEVQIQRLLNRSDATERRIVCLSAILPDGEEFDDFVLWIRRDHAGLPIRSKWRPTRVRFGQVLWANGRARLELRVGSERPFVPSFFNEQRPGPGRRKLLFPKDQRELVIATAWRLLKEGQSVLIYCPERRSVSPYARTIVNLVKYGFIKPTVKPDEEVLSNALIIGQEWLGNDHPIIACLKLGVAIHHGALPTPFRKEIEQLLRSGALRVTVSSPTLAQGLNLSATSIVMHAIHHFRDGKYRAIPAADFANIIGRAGRAFVEVEGLVLFPIFKDHGRSQYKWTQLIEKARYQQLKSGLLQLIMFLLRRLNQALDSPGIDALTDYVLNNASAWEAPRISEEPDSKMALANKRWRHYIALLDTALLSLVGEESLVVDELSVRLDELLSSSLWQRQVARYKEEHQVLLQATLEGRAKVIWAQSSRAQRRGYFLAGVGLASGQALDALAADVNPLIVESNSAILEGKQDHAVHTILEMAKRLFAIEPFVPDPCPDDWPQVLTKWLKGERVTESNVAQSDDLLRFVENGLVYKLSWAIDAVRVRALANEDTFAINGSELTIDNFETGLVVPCVEMGTLNPCAARLMQAGFKSRLAAIKAVTDTDARFETAFEMRKWLYSTDIQILSVDETWPTTESHQLWLEFIDRYVPADKSVWSIQPGEFPVIWNNRQTPQQGEFLRLWFDETGEGIVLSSTFEELGTVDSRLKGRPQGVFAAWATREQSIRYVYRGPEDIEETA